MSEDMQSLHDMLLGSSIDGMSCGAGSQSLGGIDVPEAFGMTPDAPVQAQTGGITPLSGGSGPVASRLRGAGNNHPSLAAAGSRESAAGEGCAPHNPLSLEEAGSGDAAARERGAPSERGASNKPPSRGAGGSRVTRHSTVDSTSSVLSDDGTENDDVFSSDGNMIHSDGNMGSIIGSIDGEGSGVSDSDYVPQSTRSSPCSDEMPYSFDNGVETGVSCHRKGDVAACLERPGGMMLAKEDPNYLDRVFVCSKIWQKYKTTVGDACVEVFQVVFKDGSKTEYSGAEVS
ncbi:unnamed protein product [Sphacelaria rigidula]